MPDDGDLERMAYRLGRRTPCCDRIVRHVTRTTILCRGCGTLYRDVTSDVLAAFPGSLDATSMTPQRLLRGE